MSGAKAFFDTNVLLYMHSAADPHKRERAQDLFLRCSAESCILLSTQVVQEFYVAAVRKLLLPRDHVREAVRALLQLPLVTIAPPQIFRALEIEDRYAISFWDSLIVAAAESGSAAVIYTEDLNHGQRYGAVEARNPFAAA